MSQGQDDEWTTTNGNKSTNNSDEQIPSLGINQRERSYPLGNNHDKNITPLGNTRDRETTPLLGHQYREMEERAAVAYIQQAVEQKNNEKKQFLVVLAVLIINMFERLSFYGVAANLVPFLGLMNLQSPSPSTISLAFTGTCFFTPLLGGLVADARFGRYNTIFGSALVYLLGDAFLCASTYQQYDHRKGQYLHKWAQNTLLVTALVLISIGTGGVKANLAPLGADQVRDEGNKEVGKFFAWFYWFIQVGILLASTFVAYLQQEESFFYGFVVASCSIFMAIVFILLGRHSFVTYPPNGSFVMDGCKIVFSAVRSVLSRRSESPEEVRSRLDRVKRSKGGKFSDMQVEDLKLILKVVPMFLTLIVYWTMYAQVLSSYLIQGTHMKLVLPNSFKVPVASLNAFEAIAVAVMIPVFDRIVYPTITRHGLRLTPLRKIGAGMLLAAASVGVAALVEVERKQIIDEKGYFGQNPFRAPTNASHMNIFYQVPQYMLLGTSEVLVAVTGLEFAYSESPRYVHGVVIGVYLATIGAGFFLASALVAVVSKLSHSQWYPADINQGSLENYFFVLVGLMLANFALFVAMSVRYRYTGCPSYNEHYREIGDVDQRRRGQRRLIFCR